MRRIVLALLSYPLLAGVAHAGPQAIGALSLREAEQPRKPRLDFRLVQDPISDPAPVHNSGMVAQTEVGPNATLGVGLLKAAPRKFGSGEWRTDSGAPSSRKAAVSFRLKF